MADLSRINKLKKSKLLMLWDIPVFLFIIIITAVFLIVAFTQPKGDTVAVYIKNVRVAVHKLSVDIEKEYTSEDGKYTLLLEIKDGKASIGSATCPDKICRNMPSVSRVHQTIVCLPAYIVIRVEGKSIADGGI